MCVSCYHFAPLYSCPHVLAPAESIEAVWIPIQRFAGSNLKSNEVNWKTLHWEEVRPPENKFPVKSCLVLAGLIAKTMELHDATAS